jgi:uncharacterized protein YbaR (Trm112 family)
MAEPALVEKLNQQIAGGSMKNRGGKPVQEKIDAGLIRTDGKIVYPIRRDIPVMLVEEGLPIG